MASFKPKVLLKVIILGNSGVGKTAMLHKYVQGQFIEEHKITIGADFLTKEIFIDEQYITLQIWDTAGQERFQSLTKAFYRGSDACALVYDITDKESFEGIKAWYERFLEQIDSESKEGFPFVLIGNKNDLSETKRQVSYEEGQELAKSLGNLIFYETSALNGLNIEKAIHDLSAFASSLSDMNINNLDANLYNEIQRDLEDGAQGEDETPPADARQDLLDAIDAEEAMESRAIGNDIDIVDLSKSMPQNDNSCANYACVLS